VNNNRHKNENAGHLLENLVFTTLRRVTPDIFYYKSKGGKEVDSMGLLADRSRLLVAGL
jgi:predicted AAA+ superfamily ATPase